MIFNHVECKFYLHFMFYFLILDRRPHPTQELLNIITKYVLEGFPFIFKRGWGGRCPQDALGALRGPWLQKVYEPLL